MLRSMLTSKWPKTTWVVDGHRGRISAGRTTVCKYLNTGTVLDWTTTPHPDCNATAVGQIVSMAVAEIDKEIQRAWDDG